MSEPLSASEVLLRATTRARQLRGRVLVVKLGGSAMEDPAATRGTLASVVALQTLGVRLVLVHGGGKPIDRAMAAAGLTPKKVAGRRYTDAATLAIVVRVLRELNAGLVAGLIEQGGKAGFVTNATPPEGLRVATDFTALTDFPITADRLTLTGANHESIELGHVGRPTQVNAQNLGRSVAFSIIPVVPSLAKGPDGGWLNVNADTAASAVAGALKAEACYFLTDTPGVLRDVSDPGSLIPRLTRRECEQLVRDGVIAGGMIPKVEACFEALDAGAGRAVILDGRDPYALLSEFVSANPRGTVIVP